MGARAYLPAIEVDFNAARVLSCVGCGGFRRQIDYFADGVISGPFGASDWAIPLVLGIYAQTYMLTAPERWAARICPETGGGWRKTIDRPRNAPELRHIHDVPLLIITVRRA